MEKATISSLELCKRWDVTAGEMENLMHDRLSFAGGLASNFDIAFDLDIDDNLPAVDVADIVDKYMKDSSSTQTVEF